MPTVSTLAELAGEAYDYFETAHRPVWAETDPDVLSRAANILGGATASGSGEPYDAPIISNTAQELARAARTAREKDTPSYTRTKDDAPEWIRDLVRDAHGKDYNGSPLMFPDDWRYETIHSALGAIHDAGDSADLDDLAHEWSDGNVDDYTHARLRWLASDLNRANYCDDAAGEFGSPDGGIIERIAWGQFAEAREIFDSVRRSLEEHWDEINEAD
jgi:hypothetical protein